MTGGPRDGELKEAFQALIDPALPWRQSLTSLGIAAWCFRPVACRRTSFTTTRINKTTFVIQEDDAFREHPLIYVKLHPTIPVAILSDTGCDEPSEHKKHAACIHLRQYLEKYPVPCNGDAPLNPGGVRQYIIIVTHCHYDHLGGVSQFLEGGTTEIIASDAGRHFIESDLETHGLFKFVDMVAPWFVVTHWAQSFEKLQYPIPHEDDDEFTQQSKDLGITILHTPGHTPDELAWYDHDEMYLYVGDSFYEELGDERMPIIWPGEGNMIEWAFSMQKLKTFIKSQNYQAETPTSSDGDADYEKVARRVKVGCGHQTHSADAEELMERLERFWWAVLRGDVPVRKKEVWRNDATFTWREVNGQSGISFKGPARLLDSARTFFKHSDGMKGTHSAGFV
ncbi:hypothetical protein DOTSEDRAFT_87250 [Dothistroma septosporum NZE10]|uniref:Metallo-beta-lactamase domain-containing protein n=1 Tax=Dothistroma septosporum (strain NZE10 / CBS 128990) TaxID=675120 RepID=N1PTM0_DOTSN|nr:hypothetical protein DOTSEDRAFT_87250 [Dothistroma septosporum NZE10]